MAKQKQKLNVKVAHVHIRDSGGSCHHVGVYTGHSIPIYQFIEIESNLFT